MPGPGKRGGEGGGKGVRWLLHPFPLPSLAAPWGKQALLPPCSPLEVRDFLYHHLQNAVKILQLQDRRSGLKPNRLPAWLPQKGAGGAASLWGSHHRGKRSGCRVWPPPSPWLSLGAGRKGSPDPNIARSVSPAPPALGTDSEAAGGWAERQTC